MPHRTADRDVPARPEHVVVKLGGSLLSLPDLRCRLRTALNRAPHRRPLIVTGGGAAADCVRRWQSAARLDDRDAHRLAIRAMSDNAELLHRLWPEIHLVTSRTEATAAWARGLLPLLLSDRFLEAEESAVASTGRVRRAPSGVSVPVSPASPLPASWDVTSDAIAAWVACRWPATRLLLLKSCDPAGDDVGAWSRAGQVDPVLPGLTHNRLTVQMINLRRVAACG